MFLKTKRLIIFIFVFIFTIFLSFGLIAYAHSGGTDSNGGHYDSSTGEYHYHHGYPAHQHIDGECPYDFDDKTDESNTNSTNKYTKTEKSNFNKTLTIITAVFALIDIIVFTVYWKKELSEPKGLLANIFGYIKSLGLTYVLFLIFSIPTIFIWVLIDEFILDNMDIDSVIIYISPFYTAILFMIGACIIKIFNLIVKTIKNKCSI